MHSEIERYRTRKSERPAAMPRDGEFSLVLPQHYALTRMWQAMQNASDGDLSASSPAGVEHRPVDAPVVGDVMVIPRDERDAKYGRPLFYYTAPMDDGDDREPLMIVGAGEYHWQQLKEWGDEARHYGWDKPERPPDRPVNRIVQDLADYGEAKARARKGIRTTGALPRRD